MNWLAQYGTYLDQGGPAAFVEFLGSFFTMLVVMRFVPEDIALRAVAGARPPISHASGD